MYKELNLSCDEWFDISKHLVTNVNYYVITGARGCGKTHSLLALVKKYISMGLKILYVRNAQDELSTARQYFSCLVDDPETQRINLGSLGANTIVLETKQDKNVEKCLIGYTMFLGDYESFKSSKRMVDVIIYEEFSSFKTNVRINRVFSLIEIMETIKQTSPNFKMFAISNNIYKDSLFDVLLNDEEFLHVQISKENKKHNLKNSVIQKYLNGDYLVPELNINLSLYQCLGYVQLSEQKVYIYYNDIKVPFYVVSSRGTGHKLKIDTDIISMLERAHYKNLDERNICEFLVGLLVFSGKKLRG